MNLHNYVIVIVISISLKFGWLVAKFWYAWVELRSFNQIYTSIVLCIEGHSFLFFYFLMSSVDDTIKSIHMIIKYFKCLVHIDLILHNNRMVILKLFFKCCFSIRYKRNISSSHNCNIIPSKLNVHVILKIVFILN